MAQTQTKTSTTDLISIIKTHGDLMGGIYYPASQQYHPLPELLASDHHVGISFYIEIEGFQFFVEENPGNINGSFFTVYYDGPVLEMRITRELRSIINNNQDAIGINFTNVNLNVNC